MTRIIPILLFLGAQLFAANPLPPGAFASCVQVDAAGNIYLAGPINNNHAFVAKLSPDASRIVYVTTLAGSGTDIPNALAIGSDGSAYVTGYTTSLDFPATPRSMQPAAGNKQQAFAAMLDPGGNVKYASYVGGTAFTVGNGIAVDTSGAAYVTGRISDSGAGFPVTPGSVRGNPGTPGLADSAGFVVKLDPSGSTALISILGFGGNQITLDNAGNIIAVGGLTGSAPTTAGAFQTTAQNTHCGVNFLTGQIPCYNQHVSKIDPTGTRLIFGTYVTGYWGASPAAIAIDAEGNIVLAGVTNSPNYPTTTHAYQPQYLFFPSSSFAPTANTYQPVGAGYVTKLNASGTALVWSTFFSGSGIQATSNTWQDGDGITGMVIDPSDNIVISGYAKSSDLPGLWTTPVALRPSAGSDPTAAFVTRLTPDGVKLSATQLLAPSVFNPFNNYVTAVALRSDASVIAVPQFESVNLSDPPRVASISDIDNTRLVRVAPGQLLTLWGTKLSPPQDGQPSGPFPASFNGIAVAFNGIPAPILFASGDQINLQVPYEISAQKEITMQVTAQLGDPPVTESFILGVAESQPSMLLSPANWAGPLFGVDACRGVNYCMKPFALNEDGTVNGQDNPAASGSTVMVFLNGIGLTSPELTTGAVSTSLSTITPGVTIPCCSTPSAKIVETDTIPGSSTTIAQVRVQVSSTSSPVVIPLGVKDSTTHIARGLWALIWVQPSN